MFAVVALTMVVAFGITDVASGAHVDYKNGSASVNTYYWSSVHDITGGVAIVSAGGATVRIQTYLDSMHTPHTATSTSAVELTHSKEFDWRSRCKWWWGGQTGSLNLQCWTYH